MLEHAWTEEFAVVPDDASPPLYMTPVPADAVGSYGAEAIAFIENAERKTLRWWQRLAIVRQLEHRADGTLCHSEVIESCRRRAGKSVRLRGVALWRMQRGPELFGEVQTVVHTGSDMAICREIQRGAWRWAEDEAEWDVTRANGKESIETPAGDRWLVRSQDGVYGYDVTLGLGDECWNVKPGTITEGMEPATLERSSPQIQLTSTAHRRATSLMRNKIVHALTAPEPTPGVLVLIWAAPHGSDPSDPAVWRAASPYWSDSVRQLIQNKYDAALAGEVDPQADDPDPMAGFVAQYLNVWPMGTAGSQKGDAIATELAWTDLAAARPAGTPRAAAIESWFAAGVSLALSWHVDGRAVVSVTDHFDLADAVTHLKAAGYRGQVTVGASLVDDPVLKSLRVKAGQGRAGAAAGELVGLLRDDAFRHDGSEHLAGQVLAARTVPGTDGLRLISHGRADAIKALVWAVKATRRAPAGKPRILMPTAP